jgi:O-antigen/teichoic acid export membrane protein
VHLRSILRNIFSNWASYLVTALVGFFLAPLVVHSLGNTGYGLWTLVLSLTGYFGLLDLGIRSSVGRFVARYVALGDEEGVNRTVTTAFTMLTAGGTLAFLVTLVVVGFFFDSFKIEPQFRSAGRVALLITGLNVSCILPVGVCSAILIALERFDVLSGVTIIGELIRAALVVTMLKLGHGVVALAVIMLVITALQYSAMAVFVKKLYAPLRLRLRFINRHTFRELFGFGIYRFFWIVANQLIFYSDSVVIGIFLGAGAITYYAIAGSVINYGRNVVSLVTDTFYPAATRMDANKNLVGLRELLLLGTKMALIVAVPLCLGFVFLGKQFIVLWMGKNYGSSATFLLVLTIPQLGSMSQYVSSLVLAGMARHRALAYFVLAEGVANLVLSIVLIKRIGLIGVAWGTVIPDLIFMMVVIPFYTLRVLKLRMREYLKACLAPLLCGVPTAGLAYLCSITIESPTWPVFGGEVMAICLVFGTISYFLCLDTKQRASVATTFWIVFHREVAVAHEA